MKPAAKIYLQESAVLEEARDELARELDDLWDMIWEEAEPQLEELAQSYDRGVHLRENKAEKGKFQIKPLPKSGVKTTKGNIKINGKADSKPKIFIRDPRTSETPGTYHVQLRLAKDAALKIKKEFPDAPKKMEQLFIKQGVTGAVKFESGTLWSTTISITPDDLDKTISEVADTVCQLFRVITEFDKVASEG